MSSTSAPAGSSSGDGWLELFDGRVVKGLRAYGGAELPRDRWTVDEGLLRTVAGPGSDLISEATFGDLELEFSWGLAPGGNSGVMVGVIERAEPAWWTGAEYQLLDDAGHPDGRDPRTATGALYGLLAPTSPTRLAPVGALNRSRIVSRGGRVEHWLDGERVLVYDRDDAGLRTLIAESKFRDSPEFMRADRGHIVLQHHGEVVWFGEIRVRELPTDR